MRELKHLAEVTWQSPSNIALVKYWGKKGEQLPANPSISFSLNQALTETTVRASFREKPAEVEIDFYFENARNEAFEQKLKLYLQKAASQFQWLNQYRLEIRSSNTFPHSSGIASSASAYCAMALCLCSLHEEITGEKLADFFRTASFWARIGSGSACRSVYGGYNLWGKTPALSNSSDEYAIHIDDNHVHPDLQSFNDTILIVEKGKKAVSSTEGHALLKQHPFAEMRYQAGFANTERLLEILGSGNLREFIQLVESEALMLHALMMTSGTPFILMKPNTLAIIEKIWDFRRQTASNLMFTLDAGANVHLLHPVSETAHVQEFVQNELLGYCQNDSYFCNAIGKGPVKKEK
jgi:diphosphomevalonate decarboxylase